MKVRLVAEFKATGIPYTRQPEDGHPFVRLKGNLDALSLLPEPLEHPILRQVLEAINAPETVVETVGCAVWDQMGHHYDEHGHLDIYERHSYVALIFSDPQVGDQAMDWLSVFMMLSEELEVRADGSNGSDAYFTLKPFTMYDQDRAGWQAELWVVARWREQEARDLMWATWLELLSALTIQIAEIVHKRKIASFQATE